MIKQYILTLIFGGIAACLAAQGNYTIPLKSGNVLVEKNLVEKNTAKQTPIANLLDTPFDGKVYAVLQFTQLPEAKKLPQNNMVLLRYLGGNAYWCAVPVASVASATDRS